MDTKPKIIVIDDEDALRVGVKRILEMEGYDVDTAENGTEGIRKGIANDFDLAIIDLKMPDISGIEVLREFRQVRPNTICFIATAYASYETAIQATKLGADGYIPKPFTSEELLSQLEAGLKKRQLVVEAERLRLDRERRLLEVHFERTRLNTIINSLADGVLVVNKEGQAVLYNPASLNFLQLDEIKIEEYIVNKLPPEVGVIINQFLYSTVFHNSSYSAQLRIKGDNETFVEVTCSPVPHPDGSLAGVVTVIKDISEFKRLEYLKSQFVSMVAHELKAPIAATLGFINILTNKDFSIPPDQQLDFLNRSSSRLTGLLNMVNDLLDISRMEMKTSTRELKQLDLRDVIKDVLNLFQFEIDKKKLIVDLKLPETFQPITADLNEVQRLTTNLVSNAIKYNKENGEIIISLTSTSNYLILSVKDSGIGLKPVEKEKLFSEFFRAKNEFTKNIHGTGLGLSLVKKIVDSYSGKVEVDSEYGKGTTFRVFLPFKSTGGEFSPKEA
ncbi:MAG TPA: response regulator [Ignavibacteriaceae bacterium]|nr:response regulator [Ignavibacteriaceae bacterium]